MAAFMPWPWNGTMAWAASPTSTARSSKLQPVARSVPSAPAGFSTNCSARSGQRAAKSANSAAKNASTAAAETSDRNVSDGANRVTVKSPPGLASAISMNSPRGQTWRAFGSSRWPPSGPGARVSSL